MNPSVNEIPAVLTVRDVADYLKLSEMTILRLANQGILPGVKLGRQWRFSGQAVKDLIHHPEILGRKGDK